MSSRDPPFLRSSQTKWMCQLGQSVQKKIAVHQKAHIANYQTMWMGQLGQSVQKKFAVQLKVHEANYSSL